MITTINEYKKILESYSRSNLYHAIKTEYALTALDKNKLAAHSIQRYWPDGKRRKDDEEGYDESYFLRGLSLTRDKKYAANWNNIIFEFDQEKLKNKYKIIPYNWGFSIGGGYKKQNHKREKEEFLIVSKEESSFNNKEFLNMIKKPGGYIYPLDKYLVGIYISKNSYDIYTDKNTKQYEPFERIKEHKLYKGLL